ncbi:MAG: hypothetical protein GY754_23975 [bacterium]|nr:hypothetical protein [bacterium]
MLQKQKWFTKSVLAGACLFVALGMSMLYAQSPQIPNIFLNNISKVDGEALIHIDNRVSGTLSGDFIVKINASCFPPAYPAGSLSVQISMSDSSISYFESTSVDAMSSTGKHTPAVYLSGKCKTDNENYQGCRYWIMLADNSKEDNGTPDVVGFLVLDGNGNRIAYGTGPVAKGDIDVASTSN